MQLQGPQYVPGIRQWQVRNHKFPAWTSRKASIESSPRWGRGGTCPATPAVLFCFQPGLGNFPYRSKEFCGANRRNMAKYGGNH